MTAEQDAYAIALSWWRDGLTKKPDPVAFGLTPDYDPTRERAEVEPAAADDLLVAQMRAGLGPGYTFPPNETDATA